MASLATNVDFRGPSAHGSRRRSCDSPPRVRVRPRRWPGLSRTQSPTPRVAAEDRLEQAGQFLTRRAVGYLVPVPHHFPRIEHVHVDMHIYLVRQATQAVELREHGRRHIAEVINAELLDERLVEQMLFKRIGKSHAAH